MLVPSLRHLAVGADCGRLAHPGRTVWFSEILLQGFDHLLCMSLGGPVLALLRFAYPVRVSTANSSVTAQIGYDLLLEAFRPPSGIAPGRNTSGL